MAAAPEAMLFAVNDLLARQRTIGGTTFHFRKMLAMEGFELFEILRPGVGEALADMPPNPTLGDAAKAFSRLPRETVKAARAELFKHVDYTNAKTKSPVRVAGMEEGGAFEGLTPVHVYQVMVQAFVVNFSESWDVLQSLTPPTPISESPDMSTSQDS